MRTYSRSRGVDKFQSRWVGHQPEEYVQDPGRARKRRRVVDENCAPNNEPEELSSPLFAPVEYELFKDATLDAMTASSPPSSPITPSTALQPRFRKLFSRRRMVMRDVTSKTNAVSLKGTQRYTQMQIDMGGETQTRCRQCGMEYTPSDTDDVRIHRNFHDMENGGIPIGRALSRMMRSRSEYTLGRGFYITSVDRTSSLAERKKAFAILEVVNRELSSPPHDESSLWSLVADVRSHDHAARFTLYLCVEGDRCIGACLAERIFRANRVTEAFNSSSTHRSSSMSLDSGSVPALMGISRIWTTASHRRQGFASKLLDFAKQHFIYGMAVPKDLVAFSQTTESGGNLAANWIGTNSLQVYDSEGVVEGAT